MPSHVRYGIETTPSPTHRPRCDALSRNRQRNTAGAVRRRYGKSPARGLLSFGLPSIHRILDSFIPASQQAFCTSTNQSIIKHHSWFIFSIGVACFVWRSIDESSLDLRKIHLSIAPKIPRSLLSRVDLDSLLHNVPIDPLVTSVSHYPRHISRVAVLDFPRIVDVTTTAILDRNHTARAALSLQHCQSPTHADIDFLPRLGCCEANRCPARHPPWSQLIVASRA
ncbi:hypothetical protein P170DRAFT_35106 [Aspergillus steynii IBT 23096]|uniref:Uncharacterized protein n=1 Tax=Aspergillus steynii IBT 23096 TaxID=1392250 RepID=A0A2I2GQN7_9EURO|nr:uncharacterized protein P170DRAFT_35106 [Aspergillus steynii IBT 23096]PLB55181.1 hypothetical protein P170DRAFT_35106 [Aspergillus steynii IBT 23096]